MAVSFPTSLSSATQAASTQGYKDAAAAGAAKEAKKYLRYPMARLEDTSDYLSIKILKYIPKGIDTQPGTFNIATESQKVSTALKQKENILKYIYLPIPNNINDANSVTWGADSLNPVAAAGVSLTGQVIAGQKSIQDVINEVLSTVTNATTKGSIQKSITQALSGTAINALGGNVSAESLISRATGQILNPNMELLFQAVNLRTFPFVFDFAPRDAKEAKEVKLIIRTFKKAMAPKSSGSGGIGLFVSAPDIFQLEYKKGNASHPFLNQFKPMALVDMNVNYTGSNAYATYADGTPVHMQLSLTFKELNPIYSEEYGPDYDFDPNKSVGY